MPSSSTRVATTLWLRPPAPAVVAAVAAEVAEVDGVVDVGGAAVAAVLGVGGVLELGKGLGVVLEAEVDDVPRARGPGRPPAGRRRSGRSGRRARPRRRRAPPSGRPAARARRSGRAGRGRGSRAGRRAGAPRRATRGSQASSTSNRPSWPGSRPASSSAVATPQPMFDPARLCTTRRPCRSSTPAAIAQVVVLPLVAETSTAPSSSSRGHAAQGAGREPQEHPARGGGAAAAAEPAAGGPEGAREQSGQPEHQPAGTITRSTCRRTRIVAGVRASGSPSA